MFNTIMAGLALVGLGAGLLLSQPPSGAGEAQVKHLDTMRAGEDRRCQLGDMRTCTAWFAALGCGSPHSSCNGCATVTCPSADCDDDQTPFGICQIVTTDSCTGNAVFCGNAKGGVCPLTGFTSVADPTCTQPPNLRYTCNYAGCLAQSGSTFVCGQQFGCQF